MKPCIFEQGWTCHMQYCTEAQEVPCCGICPFRKGCGSRCEKTKKVPDRKYAEAVYSKKEFSGPEAAQKLTDFLNIEGVEPDDIICILPNYTGGNLLDILLVYVERGRLW